MKTFEQITKDIKATTKAVKIRIANVVARQDTQARTKTSAAQIAAYRAVYQGEPLTKGNGQLERDPKTKALVYDPAADRMPPVILAPAADHIDENPDGGPSERRYYCLDGDHRLTAASRAGLDEINAIIVDAMTIDEARFAVLGANATHGLTRTNADKQNALKIACEISAPITATATKKKGKWGKVTYKGKLANGEKVTARALAAIAGVSHEAAAAYLKATYAAKFQNKDDAAATETATDDAPTGNAKDDDQDDAPEIRDLTTQEPTEYAHSLIVGASKDYEWLAAVAETLNVWLSNQVEDE